VSAQKVTGTDAVARHLARSKIILWSSPLADTAAARREKTSWAFVTIFPVGILWTERGGTGTLA
jgi:hypothetical protein